MSQRDADQFFQRQDYSAAAASLEAGLKKEGSEGRDRLLYYLDLGLVLHTSGKFSESNVYFSLAEKAAEIEDYTSLAAEGASLLTSENAKAYKGEDFEKVLINAYKSMNFAMLGDAEAALVEARLVNRKLQRMITEGERKYKQNAFARYLSAVLYEASGEYNDAYVDYKKVRELIPEYKKVGEDLWRLASVLRITDEAEQWQEEYGLDLKALKAQRSRRKSEGEVIVIYQNGISPIKQPNPGFVEVPRFYPRFNPVRLAHVRINGEDRGVTEVLHDIEATAIENLDEKYAGIVAKRIAGRVTKEVVSYQVEKQTNSPLLGILTRVILYASAQPDLRSWNLLPKDLQIFRVQLPPGTYQVEVHPEGAAALPPQKVEVRAGKKVFVNARYMP